MDTLFEDTYTEDVEELQTNWSQLSREHFNTYLVSGIFTDTFRALCDGTLTDSDRDMIRYIVDYMDTYRFTFIVYLNKEIEYNLCVELWSDEFGQDEVDYCLTDSPTPLSEKWILFLVSKGGNLLEAINGMVDTVNDHIAPMLTVLYGENESKYRVRFVRSKK